MGNVAGVTSAIRSQGEASFSELVNQKGEGELDRLMQDARRTKNYTELDRAIIESVTPFLYHGGKGAYIPITELVENRNRNRQRGGIQPGRKKLRCRFQCWDLNKRGTKGETILHLCLLYASKVHSDLAKRLLKHFPAMINDIYTGEKFYGETILHLAIANEDPAMVKFLLDMEADYSVRACGKFFTPDDQRKSRTDCLHYEWVELCKETNYEGFVYWGDYPLSFAACLLQEECVRLLLARGAVTDAQDTNGNTVMHMLVILANRDAKQSEEYRKMFDLLHKHGARLDIRNRQDLTPLTLAAKLAHKDMFDHIAGIMRKVDWLYGDVTCAGYPLTDIDTISDNGEINSNSGLNLIVGGRSESHLDMMDGLIVELLITKWKAFARFRFYSRFIMFICYISVFISAFMLRPGTDLCAHRDDTSSLHGCNQSGTDRTFRPIDSCYLLKPYRNDDIARMVLEAIVATSAVLYVFFAMREIYHRGFVLFFSALTMTPAKALFLMSVVFVVCMIPGRATCHYKSEDVFGVLAMLCACPYFLFFCRGFRITGPFVVMIYNMIRGDLLRFVIIYSIFLMGFSQAVYIPFRSKADTVYNHPFEAIVAMFAMSVGDFEELYNHFNDLRPPLLGLIKVMFVGYMILVTLLLVNMLIAMMAQTYQTVLYTEKEWLRQWAHIVLVIELTLTNEKRKEEMYKYSNALNGGERALIIRSHQTEREREELLQMRSSNLRKRRQSIRKTTSQPSIKVPLALKGYQNI